MIHYILTYRSNQMLRWHDRYRKVIVLYVMSSRTYDIQRRSVRIQPRQFTQLSMQSTECKYPMIGRLTLLRSSRTTLIQPADEHQRKLH